MAALTPTLTRPPAPALARPLLVAAVAATAVGYVAAVDPTEPGHYPTCPFLWATGWYCPGCGSLRALHALAHGQPGAAASYNVLTMAALPLLGWFWGAWAWRTWRGVPRRGVAHPAVVWGLLVLVVGYAVARNLPLGAALAP